MYTYQLTLSLPESAVETYKVILTFESLAEILHVWCDISMKPLQQYIHMVLFIFKYMLIQNEMRDLS